MKKILYSIGGLLLLFIIFVAVTGSASSRILSSNDFIAKYKSTPNAVLVDVRTPAEFNAGHIASAINIDYENANFESEVKKLDSTKTYFMYCRSGNRSSKSIVIMNNDGIKNTYDLQGGISNAPELLNK